MKAQKLNQRQAGWALYLSKFDFTLKHILGVRMEKANGLSRRLNQKIGTENDNENQKLIKEEWVQEMIEVVGLEAVLIKKIKGVREKDKEIIKVIEEMKKIGVRNLRGDED